MRVIVVDDGAQEVALVGLDLTMVQQGLDLPRKIGNALGIPAEHVMVSATHDHNTPNQGGPGMVAPPRLAAWLDTVASNAVDAAKQAKIALQPARVGFGTGKAYVNVNRDE